MSKWAKWVPAKAAGDKTKNVGLSAKASYATDVISASVATDLGFAVADKTTVGADVAANVKYDFVTVDGYYATKAQTDKDKNTTKNLLSVKVATDLNSFDVLVVLQSCVYSSLIEIFSQASDYL